MEIKITLIKRKSFSKIRNAKLIALLTVIFIGGSVGVEAQTAPFPANAWGVYGWTQFTKLTAINAPDAKGGPILLHWSSVEPQKGVYAFDAEIRPKLQKALDNNFYVFIKVWVAPAAEAIDGNITYSVTPEWLFSNGVTLVEFPSTINPLGKPVRKFFPDYKDPDYKFYYHRMIAELGKYLLSLPLNLRSRILYVQSAEGSTGDEGPYKDEPLDSQYAITWPEWWSFRLEAWRKYQAALTQDGKLQIPILTNDDARSTDLRNYMLNELPGAVGFKEGMFSHGYQISDAQERLASFIDFRNQVEAKGKVFFARGEMDAEMNTYGWSTKNKKQALYWSSIYATHCGLTMWNVNQDALIGTEFTDAFVFFNKHAAQTTPQTAKGAFCAFYRGLDASDIIEFPVTPYGNAVKTNQQRYINICNAFSGFGARMGDVAKATGGGMTNRQANDYNDAGWKILKTNFQRHITQIEPETTSNAWWQVDASVYGRFARGFAANDAAKSKMYFDLDDKFFGTTPLNGAQTIEVSVTYRDSDAGSWELKYDAINGAMKTAMTVTNLGTETDVWKTKKVTITDAHLGNRGVKSSDFILENKGNTSCRFHMIAVDKTGIVNTRVSGVSITGCPTAAMSVNATKQLTATVSPTNATNTGVSWSSSNTAIATVSNSGLVTAKAVGSATITVSTDDGAKTAVCNVSVAVAAPTQTPYLGSNRTIPGTIEAEHFDVGGEGIAYHDDAVKSGVTTFRPTEMVDFVSKSTASNGLVVGFSLVNEWLEYTVNATAGTYNIALKYFCNSTTAGDLKISLDGVVLTTATNIVSQGSTTKQAITTISNVSVSGGTNKILRLEFVNGAKFDIDAIVFTSTSTTARISSDKTADSETVDNGFRIYPNPVSDILNLEFADATSSKQIKVFNEIGQLVYSTKTTKGSATIDVKTLNLKGLIVIQVSEGSKVSNHKILVK